MPVLASRINPRTEEFAANAAAMRALVDDLNATLAKVAEGGGADARSKHTARGKLLPRERIERLLGRTALSTARVRASAPSGRAGRGPRTARRRR